MRNQIVNPALCNDLLNDKDAISIIMKPDLMENFEYEISPKGRVELHQRVIFFAVMTVRGSVKQFY